MQVSKRNQVRRSKPHTSSRDLPRFLGTLVSLSVTLASLAQGDNIGFDRVDWRKD